MINFSANSEELIIDFSSDIDSIFTDDIPKFLYFQNEDLPIYVKNFNDILNFNKSIFIDLDDFYKLPSNIESIKLELSFNIAELSYKINDKLFSAYSYFIQSDNNENKSCSLIVPGSGINQSTEIFESNATNYHYGLKDILKKDNIYIYVKPNEDFYSVIGPNKKKLSYDLITNYHISYNGSYSASYL